MEVRWAITEDWVVALFNDWGAVTVENLFAQQDFFATLYTAVGLGVRYRTPLGPIRVDLAFTPRIDLDRGWRQTVEAMRASGALARGAA